MKILTFLALFFSVSGCAGLMGNNGNLTEDCVTRHMKALGRVPETKLDATLYDHIVDSCKEIHTGRP